MKRIEICVSEKLAKVRDSVAIKNTCKTRDVFVTKTFGGSGYNKLGITVAMAVTMILMLALITTTITISAVRSVKSSKLKAFATELSLVQNTIQEYSFGGSINEYLEQDVVLYLTSAEQFEGENIIDNTLLLHILDLEKMGISKSMYGIGKNGNTEDYYAVSLDTLKVYYIAGYDASDTIYYSLTNELIELLNGENVATNTPNVIFDISTVEWTSSPVTVTVKIPISIDINTCEVSTDNSNISISAFTVKEEYNECVVNTSKIEGNYVVTVTYEVDGEEKEEKYKVTNFDNEVPTILASNVQSNQNSYYIDNIEAIDNGKVKLIKYVETEITKEDAYEFFKIKGKELNGQKVKVESKDAKLTIYAEDYAGNYTIDVVTIPTGFYYVGGTKDTGLVISDDVADKKRGIAESNVCTGNQFVWIPVDFTTTGELDSYELDTGFKSVFKRGQVELIDNENTIYKMTAYDSLTEYDEPYDLNDWEVEEYYKMCKSVQKYKGFYIARFEAGDGIADAPRTTVTPAHTVVSKQGVYVYNYVPWGKSMSIIVPSAGTYYVNNENYTTTESIAGAVYLSRNMAEAYGYTSVVSTLCYGVQWDAVMNFVSDKNYDISNSRKWGNFSDSSSSTGASEDSGEENMNYTTGRNEAWKAKNIYDLAGNVYEWTMESISSESIEYRVCRGGLFSQSGSSGASQRDHDNTVVANYKYGFRPALYIKE